MLTNVLSLYYKKEALITKTIGVALLIIQALDWHYQAVKQ